MSDVTALQNTCVDDLVCGFAQSSASGNGSNGAGDEVNGASGLSDSDSSRPADGPTTSVTFRTQHGVAYGETIKVVGDSEYLGAWEIAAAPGEPSSRCSSQTARRYGWPALTVIVMLCSPDLPQLL